MSAEARRLLELYQGRETVFAEALVTGHNGSSKVEYRPVRRPLELEDLERHLRGEAVLGVYPIRSDSTCYFGAIDIDAEKEADLGRAKAEQLLEAAAGLGFPKAAMMVSFSGRKGHHLDLFLAETVPAGTMRLLLMAVCVEAGFDPDDFELFPKQDGIDPLVETSLGNLIKLPLATHPLTGRKAEIVIASRPVRPAPASVVFEILAGTPVPAPPAAASGPTREAPRQHYTTGHRHDRMTELSGVLNSEGVSLEAAEQACLDENERFCEPPLADGDVRDTVRAIYKRYHSEHRQGARKRGARVAVSRNQPGAAAPAPTAPNLPPDFWESRPALRRIRGSAHSRMRSADAVLASVLTRVAAGTPHQVKLPAIVGTVVPLSLLAAIVGPPGTGKSSAHGIALELLPLDPALVADQLPIGSGEGLVESLFDWRTEEYETPDGKTKSRQVKYQRFHNAHFYADEGQIVFALSSREGSVLLPTLRTLFTGGPLGQTNAERERKRVVPAGRHAFGVVAALQATMAGDLLADAGAGTPQRFVWASAIDPSIPSDPPDWPAQAISLDHLDRFWKWQPDQSYPMPLPAEVLAEVRANALSCQRGESQLDAMDAHSDLLRLKLAGLLAILDERLEIDLEDWQLATTIKATSDQVRASVEQAVQAEASAKEKETSTRLARREVEKTQAVSGWRTIECAKRIHQKVTADPGVTARAVQQDLRRWREDFAEGLEHAIADGWVVVKLEPGQGNDKRTLYPGKGNPS